MATPRVRTRTQHTWLWPDLSWVLNRSLLSSVRWGGIQFRLYDGPALSKQHIRVDGVSLVDTLIDEVGPPAVGSLSRFFPDRAPYRPLVAYGPRDYSGSGGTKEGVPSASPSHSFTSWRFSPRYGASVNSSIIYERYTKWHSNGGSYWGQEIRSGVNTEIWYWGPNGERCYDTQAEAQVVAGTLIADLLPNLVEAGWSESSRTCCVVRPDYGCPPEIAARKVTSIKEDAAVADARRLAYESMIHQAGKSQLNVLRATLELKDAPGLVPVGGFLKTVTAVQKLVKSGKIPGSLKNDPASLTLGQLAAIHLWYQFGVKPTVSDVNAFLAQLASSPVSSIEKKEDSLLMTGQTVRSAYSADTGVGERRLDNLLLAETQTMTMVLYHNSSNLEPCLHAMNNYVCALSLPEGREWRHSGTLFGRALKPEWTMMPDWFVELYDMSTFKDETLLRPTKAELCLYFNPPLKSAWNVLGYSWLSDWAWNASQALQTLERATRRIVCGFEEIWAIDRWSWSPRRWSVLPIVERPTISPNGDVKIIATPSAVETWFPGRGMVWCPCILLSNVYAAPPSLNVTQRVRYNFVLQVPPTTQWCDIVRKQIPIPPARLPEFFTGKLDAWRIGILGALSVLRLQALSRALKKAKWSIATMAVMWKQEKGYSPKLLILAIMGVVASKEFTNEQSVP